MCQFYSINLIDINDDKNPTERITNLNNVATTVTVTEF